jgi:DNA-binding NarL/FixJ family response regulator
MLIVSMHDESLVAERALRAGAHGYITKENATTDILLAIRKVLAGKIYMSEQLAVQIACKVTGHLRQIAFTPDGLSDRELRVFELIGQGYAMRQIAVKLHLDVKTVETYRARIKVKLNLKDADEVLQHAISWGRASGQI